MRKSQLTQRAFPGTMLAQLNPLEEETLSTLEKSSWKTLEIEKLNDKLSRQMLSGENATISQLLMKKGAVVPRAKSAI